MRTARNILLIILALFLQMSWTNAISFWEIKPDLIVLILVFVGITSGQIEATILGFFSGFLMDVYNPESMGINALSNSLVGFAVGYSRVGVVAEDIQVQATILFVSCLIHDLIYFICYTFPDPLQGLYLVLRYGLGTAVYTALLGTLISLGMMHIFNKRIEPHA
ncbi:MAG: rod shape-determining protein MreD [Candidatus Latescibacteria bacterium]|jgi:rod shape-determining protein MreD|nr:rod shape-determining protein MreD [Candidatus Latescibacterota bacterium]MBT5830370.1 rod shape-determining protein MreD [Candidatus Latescibacterota bacterium]